MNTLAERDTANRVRILRDALIRARGYIEHKDDCDGRVADWKLGASCTCGGDTVLSEINAALSA